MVLTSLLVSANAALAEDYTVDFGADTDRGRDAGTLYCWLGKACEGKMESLGLKVRVLVSPTNTATARIELNGTNAGCCYFAYAKDSVIVDARASLSRVQMFRGMRSRGGLFVENEGAGTLYLKFHLEDRIIHEDWKNQHGTY